MATYNFAEQVLSDRLERLRCRGSRLPPVYVDGFIVCDQLVYSLQHRKVTWLEVSCELLIRTVTGSLFNQDNPESGNTYMSRLYTLHITNISGP
jgi:hypothetical protein